MQPISQVASNHVALGIPKVHATNLFWMWYNNDMKNREQQQALKSPTASQRKNPREETNDEALLRFIRGSWYWALAAYALSITFYTMTASFFYWSDVCDITILTIGFYIFYLFIRMKLEDRVPPGIYDQFDD